MVLKLLEMCWIWPLSYLNLHDRQRLPDPSSDSQSLQEDNGPLGKTAPMPYVLPGLSSNCGQAGHWRVDGPTLPRQSNINPSHASSPQERLLSSGSGSQGCCPGTPTPNTMETTGAWDNCLGKGIWTSLCHHGWSFSNLWSVWRLA